MKIAVCGSMFFSPEMQKVGEKLSLLGYEVTLPAFTDYYAKLESRDEMHFESAENKLKHGLIKKYFEIIKGSDAILVYNQTKRGIENYIGGNSLIEIAFAHVLGKKVYMYNSIPEMDYKDEIIAMSPTIIDGDLSKIK